MIGESFLFSCRGNHQDSNRVNSEGLTSHFVQGHSESRLFRKGQPGDDPTADPGALICLIAAVRHTRAGRRAQPSESMMYVSASAKRLTRRPFKGRCRDTRNSTRVQHFSLSPPPTLALQQTISTHGSRAEAISSSVRDVRISERTAIRRS